MKWYTRVFMVLGGLALCLLIMALFLIVRAHILHQFSVTIFGGY